MPDVNANLAKLQKIVSKKTSSLLCSQSAISKNEKRKSDCWESHKIKTTVGFEKKIFFSSKAVKSAICFKHLFRSNYLLLNEKIEILLVKHMKMHYFKKESRQ